MQAKRRRDRKRGGGASASAATAAASSAAARDTSDELTASAAGAVVPFRGFSAEYVRAHRKMGNEAIRRLNIMIDLLKSGKMTEKQIKTMLPMRKPSQLIYLFILFIYLIHSQLHKIHRVPVKRQSYRIQL